MRYKTVTKAINQTFWGTTSDTEHSRYVGSYGRGTAIDVSDIDILIELPDDVFQKWDSVSYNGQSKLLQSVKSALQTTYPRSSIEADGQVVVIDFSDGMKFEVLPAFRNIDLWGNWDGTYKYPDSNMGGNWLSTNPKAEQDAMRQKNNSSKGLLFDTCKYFRRVRNEKFGSYHLSGIVIDSFVYDAMGNWLWAEPGKGSEGYESNFLTKINSLGLFKPLRLFVTLTAPGSGLSVDATSSFDCLEKVVRYIAE
jgi:predicted nucleotidyltransferase